MLGLKMMFVDTGLQLQWGKPSFGLSYQKGRRMYSNEIEVRLNFLFIKKFFNLISSTKEALFSCTLATVITFLENHFLVIPLSLKLSSCKL